jgi:1-acyl-sn-glycerol-3-phosphate acyltransferase
MFMPRFNLPFKEHSNNKMEQKVKFRWPFAYKILYSMVAVAHKLYYRRFTVVGYEKIPLNVPVIFAANHQNALMDALAVDFAARRSVAFLARADIFKKPFIAKLLNMLKILPIYRIRDGIEALGNNQEVFDNTVAVLKSNIPICILPEGNHEGKKRLRPLKKGIFRIAFQAEEGNQYNLNLHIVPVGLDFSDYFNAGTDLTVVFGTPIKIADYASQYRENENRTITGLSTLLSESMRSLMIHIPEEHYELIYQISEMYEPNVWNTCNIKRHPYNKLTIKQYIIQKATEAFKHNPEKATELNNALSKYNYNLEQAGLDDCLLQQKPARFLLLFVKIILSIILMPINIYGLILNYIPFKIPIAVASKIKDQHFKSSVNFGVSLLLFPIYYIILITIFGLFTKGLLFTVAFGLSLPVTGYFAFYYYQHLKMLWKKLRFFYFRHTKTLQYNTLQSERNTIVDLIKSTINS